MKISRKTDGSFTITGMTRDDINDLSFAVSAAETWYHLNSTPHSTNPGWDRRRQATYRRLGYVLTTVEAARSAGSVEVVSNSFDTQQQDEVAKVVKMVGLKGWDGETLGETLERVKS